MSLEVRLDAIDAPHARQLIEELLVDLNERYGDVPTAEEDEAYLNELTPEHASAPNGAFVVAWLDGEPVGCGALRPGRAPGIVEIKRMYVRPGVRGRGISRALLAALEARAGALGYAQMQLETGIRQPEAIALYESSGWSPIAAYGPYAEHGWTRCFAKETPTDADARRRAGEG
jgi:GNAT superfamily N-acetyltransferase